MRSLSTMRSTAFVGESRNAPAPVALVRRRLTVSLFSARKSSINGTAMFVTVTPAGSEIVTLTLV